MLDSNTQTVRCFAMSNNPRAKLSAYEQMAYSTVHIECEVPNGKATGTGFFYQVSLGPGRIVPLLITNKHVVAGATRATIVFTLQASDGTPDVGRVHRFILNNVQRGCFPHPNPAVDLCAFGMTELLEKMRAAGENPFMVYLDRELIPNDDEIAEMIGMEEIVMVGYPNGIWDRANNFPVFRSGVLGSHYRYDWNGEPSFLVDVATFPGSSGSPIMICDLGLVRSRSGVDFGKSRFKLIGVVFAVFQHTLTGEVVIEPIPTQAKMTTVTSMPNHLGIAVKSRELLVLDDHFRANAKP